MNDDFLNKFRKPPRPEFAADLYQRISKPMQKPSRTPAWRTVALAFSVVAVLTVVLFFSPSTRALADSIMRQIGSFIFVQGQPDSAAFKQEMAKKETVVSPEQKATLQADKRQLNEQAKKPDQAKNEITASFAPDAAAASQLAGFTVLAPAYVPNGFIIGDVKNVTGGWGVFNQDTGRTAQISYHNQTTSSFLTIEEVKNQSDNSRTIERPEIKDVTVRGLSGVWLPDQGGKNSLVWEENGITFWVVSNNLSLDELTKIAESLGK